MIQYSNANFYFEMKFSQPLPLSLLKLPSFPLTTGASSSTGANEANNETARVKYHPVSFSVSPPFVLHNDDVRWSFFKFYGERDRATALICSTLLKNNKNRVEKRRPPVV